MQEFINESISLNWDFKDNYLQDSVSNQADNKTNNNQAVPKPLQSVEEPIYKSDDLLGFNGDEEFNV